MRSGRGRVRELRSTNWIARKTSTHLRSSDFRVHLMSSKPSARRVSFYSTYRLPAINAISISNRTLKAPSSEAMKRAVEILVASVKEESPCRAECMDNSKQLSILIFSLSRWV